MADTNRFTLINLIEVSPFWTRYLGTLSDGISTEICLLNRNAFATENTALDFDDWIRRLRLTTLVIHPGCRSAQIVDAQHEPPYFVLRPMSGRSLNDLLSDQTLDLPMLVDLAKAAADAVAACEGLGLTVGGLTLNSVFLSAEGQWTVDVSGIQSAILTGGIPTADDLATLAPEYRNVPADARQRIPFDSTGDMYSLGALLRTAVERSGHKQQPVGSRILELASNCLADDPMDRPTAKEFMTSLLVRSQSTGGFDGDSFAFEGTLELETPRAAPAGVLLAGSQLGRYTIGEKLGEGAMGAVYRAHDAVEGTTVAIKVLNKEVTKDSLASRRFAKESRLLARANNPYVANLLEVNSEASVPYMAVEFVSGGTLASLLKPGHSLNETLALTLITDTVRGLAVAHSRGIVHRDFKPDNVLLTDDARQWLANNDAHAIDDEAIAALALERIYAKVSDFGLARTAHQSESMAMTRDGALLGTPLYMSPEQCRGDPAGPPSDVYSVGATLFQLLSGKPPFEAATQIGLMNKHCNEAPPSLKQLRPRLSDMLVRTVEKCLAKNADARYATAEELLVDLENLLRGQPTSLGLHPPIISLNDPDALRFEHSWELSSSPAQLWPYVSNTDRVNHALGLPAVTYTTRVDPVHGVERFAEIKVAGQKVRWQEHPYEWIEGKRLSVFREFTHGPFRWFVNIVELQSTIGGGTRVTQTFTVTPRNWLGKQIARLQLGNKARTGFGRTYQQIDEFLTNSQSADVLRDPFVVRTELAASQRQKLQTRLDSLRGQGLDPLVLDTLLQFLQHASDLEVARIRPLALAERFQLDSTQVINACLLGTRAGVFTLLWDIMCPSCRIPANIQETLSAIKDHGYCEACNLNFAVDLADSVELIFRVHPEIRSVETRTYCIGGPAWSRHVVAQVRLAPGERFACELELSEGAYTVRGPQLPFVIDLRVGSASARKRIELTLARPPVNAMKSPLQIGTQVIHFYNDSGRDQQIRIERKASRHDALSAAKASTMALFRELFADEVLSSDQMVSVAHITILRVNIHSASQLYRTLGDGPAFSQIRVELDRMLRIVQDQFGAVVKTIGEGVLASFSDPLNAVQAAFQIGTMHQPALQISAALHSGPAMVATLDDRLDYFGNTLQELDELLAAAPPGTLFLSAALSELPDVHEWLTLRGAKVDVVSGNNLPSDLLAHRVALKTPT